MPARFLSTAEIVQIRAPGDLLSTNVDSFRSACQAEIERLSEACHGGRARIDLTNARMIDSAGLNVLVAVIRKLKSLGRPVVIQVHDPHVHRICLFTRLDRLAEIERS